jgi:transposase
MTISKTKFTKTFKLQTLELANQPNTCIAQLARDLGIRRN